MRSTDCARSANSVLPESRPMRGSSARSPRATAFAYPRRRESELAIHQVNSRPIASDSPSSPHDQLRMRSRLRWM